MSAYPSMKGSGVEWIGEIPEPWNVLRGKAFMSLLSRPLNVDDEIVTCFRDGEVTLRKNRREDGFTNALKEIGYQGIEPGDLVVHAMDGFAGAIGISDARGKVSPVLNVLDCDQNKRYIMYYLRALAYRDVFMALSTGIRVRSCDLRWSKLATLPYIIPSAPEQSAIVSFLDSACADIDTAIAEAKASIEDYKLLKQSVITHAVTKGLNPNAPMKDSGVGWIGEIPRDWNAKPLKRTLIARDGGAWGEDPRNDDNDRVCLRIADFCFDRGRFGVVDLSTLTMRNYRPDQIRRLSLQRGDLLIEKSGGGDKTPVGRVVLFDKEFPALYANFMDRIRVDATVIVPDYAEYWFRNMYYRTVTTAYIKQTTGIQNLDVTDFLAKETIAYPTADVQLQITSYLDSVCTAMDAVIAEKQSIISDLESYKKSLIYEVVTGKRRVA